MAPEVWRISTDEVLRLSLLGHADALCEAGFRYYFGNSAKKDEARAAEMFVKAAEKGDEVAKGVCAWKGFGGCSVDLNEALRLFRLSAQPFSPPSISSRCYFYEKRETKRCGGGEVAPPRR